ncbi:15795_t:CDS:2 [Dentiscutata erythropus]|uniref:15795_t:CDS:1 n=1 Tax=Dentiscutata erythropus TaxID=1348616 RepID=A0A9N9N7F2_9GLOM|nr:15795_t:CDS:2 [Dentiscutata erythropus]
MPSKNILKLLASLLRIATYFIFLLLILLKIAFTIFLALILLTSLITAALIFASSILKLNMILILSFLLFPGLIVGFSVLFKRTINKSESTCSDKSRPTNRDFYKNTDDSRRLHFHGYSASDIEIEYSNYLYSIQTISTLNSEDYKTPIGNHVSKQNYSSAIENIDSYSLRTTNINDIFGLFYRTTSRIIDSVKDYESEHEDVRHSEEEIQNSKKNLKSMFEDIYKNIHHLEKNIKSLSEDCHQLENYLSNKNTKLYVDIRDFLKELKKFDNFYLFGDIHCIGGVRA